MAIKADATLVNAAFREGQTRAMGDVLNMKPLFESTANIQKTYMDTVTGVIDQLKERKEQEDIAKEKGLKPVNDAAKGVYSAIYDGGEPLPGVFVDAFTGRVEELQAQFEKVNTEGKGDTKANARKRREISGELMRLKNEAVNVRKNFMISTQDPDKWNESRIKSGNIDPLMSIFGLWKDPNNTPKGITAKIVNGKLQVTTSGYSTGIRKVRLKDPENTFLTDDDLLDEEEYKFGDARTFTSEDIVGALNYENAENDNHIISLVNNGATQGEVDGKVKGAAKDAAYGDRNNQQDATDIAAWFKEDPKRFDDVVGRGINGLNGDEGFKKAIRVNPNISLDIINTMFTDDVGLRTKIAELDVAGGEEGGDGVIDSEDLEGLSKSALQNFNKNWDMVESALTDSEDPNFSEKVSFPLIAEYYANFKKQNYDDSYATTWEKNNPTLVKDYKATKNYYDAEKARMDFLLKQKEYNTNPPAVDYFKGVTASNPLKIRGVQINDKGALTVIRNSLMAGGGFPIGDFIKVAPDGKGGWTMTKYDEETGKEMENGTQSYSSTEDFVKNGLNSNSPGFQNLKEYGKEEEIVLTEEEKKAGIIMGGDGKPRYKANDGLYYIYKRK
tara:strand:- start:3138 stop:4979 length:1842 start_codon:yes stop_codon:yes gene_type:complete